MTKKIIFCLLVLIYSCASIKSIPTQEGKVSSTGFFYSLPKTYLNVAVTLQKIEVKKGFYFDYAECVGFPLSYLNTINEATVYRVKEAKITNNVYLDKTKIFKLDVNQKFLNKSEFSFEYGTNGELTNSSITNENQIVPAIITTANIVKDISGAASFLGYGAATVTGCRAANLPDYVSADLKRIADINTALNGLLEDGPEGLDKDQLEYRIKVLKDLKNEIIAKFTKTTTVKTATVVFEIDPESLDNPIELFSYDAKSGFLRTYETNVHDSSNLITDDLPFKSKIALANPVKVTIDRDYLYKVAQLSNNAEAAGSTDNISETGSFFYRIPAIGKFKVLNGNRKIGEASLAVPQAGATVAAPDNLRNITFKLHPGLGSIYTVSGKSEDGKFGEIDSLRKTLFTNKNEKTIKELEEQLKIKQLREELLSNPETSEDN